MGGPSSGVRPVGLEPTRVINPLGPKPSSAANYDTAA
jgi:hypothetical protein